MDQGSVVVYEAGDSPTGATITNHGRLHLGTAGFSVDSVELMRRRHRGSQLWRQFGVGEGAKPGIYVFDDQPTFDEFQSKCAAAEIPWRLARHLPTDWIDDPLVAVEVSEYGFDPARVTEHMRFRAEACGAAWRLGSTVLRVDSVPKGIEIRSTSGSEQFDVVVNCTARWASSIAMGWRDTPLFDIDWSIWQIMAAPASELPPLPCVIVRTRPSGQHASVVPHSTHVTLDFKSDADLEPSAPPPGPRPVLRPVTRGDRYLETCIQAFPVLATANSVVSFEGIQGRVRGAAPGSINTPFVDADVPEYVIAQGGQASTALLDGLETLEHLWSCGYLHQDPHTLLGGLIRSDLGESESRTSHMAWEAAPDERVRALEG